MGNIYRWYWQCPAPGHTPSGWGEESGLLVWCRRLPVPGLERVTWLSPAKQECPQGDTLCPWTCFIHPVAVLRLLLATVWAVGQSRGGGPRQVGTRGVGVLGGQQSCWRCRGWTQGERESRGQRRQCGQGARRGSHG